MSTSLWPQLITSALTASASASASQPHSLSALVQQEAVVITSQLQAHENSSSSSSDNSRSSLADTASFLVELTRFLSQLADCMIDEQRIEAQLERDVDRFEARTDFSELKALDLLNAEHRALKSAAHPLLP